MRGRLHPCACAEAGEDVDARSSRGAPEQPERDQHRHGKGDEREPRADREQDRPTGARVDDPIDVGTHEQRGARAPTD